MNNKAMKENKAVKFLDCSLRDGGYYTNWDFEPSFVEEYLQRMNRLPVDYVELGYRSLQKEGYLGAYFYCPDLILKKAAELSDKKLAIILNEKDLKAESLEDLLQPCQGIISLVRMAISPQRLSANVNTVCRIRNMGFEVSLNVMYLSTWDRDPTFLEELSSYNGLLDFFYLVDSYGGMYPEEVRKKISMIRTKISVPLGFHAHNNLELALANTLAAMDSGVQIVDSTIMGMGRGAGNLKTELLFTSLQSRSRLEVDYDELSQLAGLFSGLHSRYQWGTNLAYMVSGANSLPQQQVMDQMSKRFYSLNSIVRAVHNKSLGVQDNLQLPEFAPEENFPAAIIIGGGPSATLHAEAVKEFLNRSPDTCLIHASSRNSAAYMDVVQQQYHCLIGNEGHRLEKFYKQLEKSDKIAVLPPYPRTMGTYIPPALKDKAFQLKEVSFPQTENESVTALAIDTALKLRSRRIFFIGYDGYEGTISDAQMDLFQENEVIFESLQQHDIPYSALTPTKYSNLTQESIFSLI